MRKFEKISFEQFKKDISDDNELYNNFRMPCRETKFAAGYDFFSLFDFVMKPGEVKKIPTGIKVAMENDEFLALVVKGGQGFKYNVRLINQFGVADKDFYNNPGNEGHLWIGLKNEGNLDYVVRKGDGIAQGIFMKYLVTDDDGETSKILRENEDDRYLKEV
jgi:dUTP pyrophosphatase